MPDIAVQPMVSKLKAVLMEARSRARRDNRSVLASLSLAIDGDTPFPGPASSAEAFVWERPDRGLRMAGMDAALKLDAAGLGRFEVVRGRLNAALDGAVRSGEGVPPEAPVAFAGFAFDPARPPEGVWRDFPDAYVVVPRLLYAARDGVASLTLNAVVDADSDVEAAATALALDASTTAKAGPCSAAAGVEIDSEDDHDRWAASVSGVTDLIGRDEAEKVVLARRVRVRGEGPFVLSSILDRLRGRYANCTIFAVRRGEACFLGATPETLVRLEAGLVRADCLAGSSRRGASEAEDEAIGAALLGDDKERREHAMVVNGLRESLAGVCAEIEAPDTPVLRRMANVQHLYTPLTARTDGRRHVLELVERLHPTPATGGLPRSRAMCLIREHETFSRGWYAGPIGWIDAAGGGEFAVALRSALVEGDQALLYAGCGIVRGSDPEREYEESRIKLEAMLWALKGS